MMPAVQETRAVAPAAARVGMRLGTYVAIVLITCKLAGAITWSWWWVLAPFWLGPVAMISFLILIGGLAAIARKP